MSGDNELKRSKYVETFFSFLVLISSIDGFDYDNGTNGNHFFSVLSYAYFTNNNTIL